MPRHIGILIPFYYLSNNFKADIETLQETVDASQPYAGKIIVVNDGTALSTIRNAESRALSSLHKSASNVILFTLWFSFTRFSVWF